MPETKPTAAPPEPRYIALIDLAIDAKGDQPAREVKAGQEYPADRASKTALEQMVQQEWIRPARQDEKGTS